MSGPALWTLLTGPPKARTAGNLCRALYRKKAVAFIAREVTAGKKCPVVSRFPELRRLGFHRLTQVHHIRGRLGALLLDERFWMAVSAVGHDWIHSHVEEARRLGWLAQPGEWNTPLKKGLQ